MSGLIDKSYLSGTVPNVFKIAKVVPFCKAESRILSSNYRPICLLSNIGRIIEKLMHKRLNIFLEEKSKSTIISNLGLDQTFPPTMLFYPFLKPSNLIKTKMNSVLESLLTWKKHLTPLTITFCYKNLNIMVSEGLQMNSFHPIWRIECNLS